MLIFNPNNIYAYWMSPECISIAITLKNKPMKTPTPNKVTPTFFIFYFFLFRRCSEKSNLTFLLLLASQTSERLLRKISLEGHSLSKCPYVLIDILNVWLYLLSRLNFVLNNLHLPSETIHGMNLLKNKREGIKLLLPSSYYFSHIYRVKFS